MLNITVAKQALAIKTEYDVVFFVEGCFYCDNQLFIPDRYRSHTEKNTNRSDQKNNGDHLIQQ